MQAWSAKVLCEGAGFRPRQFEFNPHVSSADPEDEATLVFGTIKGEVVVARLPGGAEQGEEGDEAPGGAAGGGGMGVGPRRHPDVVASFLDKPHFLGKDSHDSILGLSWLRKQPGRFLVGSSCGVVHLCQVGADRDEGGLAARSIVRRYETFPKLTSIHGNCEDQYVLVSGYSHDVRLYDMETGAVVRTYAGIHEDHINISRFANHSPNLFATSSFDRTMKLWDLRCKGTAAAPVYTVESELGNVMVCWSPESDTFLLASAVDNAVTQYLAVDGRRVLALDIPNTGLEDNFTRAYYTCSGRVILSGSSEEQVVRLHCAQTGEALTEGEMYPWRKHESLYIQSLRGDPLHEHRFAILVNYRDSAYPLEIIAVDMKKQLQHSGADGAAPTSTSTTAPPAGGGEGDESLASFLPTARLVKDLAAWHAEATREVPLSSSAMAATTAAALRPPASPSACLAPLSLRDDDGAGPAGRGEEEDEEAVLLLVTSAAAAAPAGGEAMEVDGEGSSSSSSSSAPKLFRVAAPVVCARCPAIRERVLAAAAAAAAAAATISPNNTKKAQPLLLVPLPFAYHPRPPAPATAPWAGPDAPQPRPPTEAFPLLLRYLFCDDLQLPPPQAGPQPQAAAALLPLLESLHRMAQELSLPRLASLVEAHVAAHCLAVDTTLEVLELAWRLGPVAQGRLGRHAAYYAALHQDVLWPLYAQKKTPAPRLAWLRARVEQTVDGLGMLQPVAPGSLRPRNADGSYDDDSEEDEEEEGSEGGDDYETASVPDEEEEAAVEVAAPVPQHGPAPSPPPQGQQGQQAEAEMEPPRLGTCLARTTGHSATLVRLKAASEEGGGERALMVVLGGGNRRSYLPMRNPLIYDARARRWSKVQATGDAPASRIHHTATALDERRILLFAGMGHARLPSDPSAPAPDEALYLLDLLALRWHKLGPAPPPSLPTVVDSSPLRHNLTPEAIARGVARVEPRMRHTAVVRREGRPPASVLAAAELAALPPAMRETFIFGGYSHPRRAGLADLLLLTAEYDHVGGDDPGPPARLVWSRPDQQGEPPAPRLGHGAVLMDFPDDLGGPRMLLFGGIGTQMIFGDVHSCRVADPDTYYATGPAALTAFNLESVAEGSARRRRRRVVWEAVELVGGDAPEARYGHTLTRVDAHTLAVFGGMSHRQQRPVAFSDLWLLHVEPPSADREAPLRVSFTCIPVVGGPTTPGFMLPPPAASTNPYWFARPDATSAESVDPSWYPSVRARHTAVFVPPLERGGGEGDEGTLLIYGGSDEGSQPRWRQLQDQAAQEEAGEDGAPPPPPPRRRPPIREVDTHVFELGFQRGPAALALLRRARAAGAAARAAARAARGDVEEEGEGEGGRSGTPQPTPAQEQATDHFVHWLLLHAQGAVAESCETTMAALLEQGADALAASPAAVDETATWGADPSRVRAVAAERPLDVRIVAGRAEPPITVLPSTLVADLRGLLRFPTAADGGDGGLWPRLFQSVALRVAAAAGAGGEGEGEGEEQEAASSSDAEASYTVWAHRSWIARRCPYFGRALASGMREAADRTIALGDVSPAVLRTLLIYIYTDTLQTTAAGEEGEGGAHDEDEDEDEAESLLFPLLVLAHRLGLDSLVALCEGYIREALNEENCLDVLQYADEFTLPNLSTVALAKIARCFDQLGLGEGAARAEERLPPHLLAQARAFHARIEALHADAEAAAAAAGGAGPGGAEEEAA